MWHSIENCLPLNNAWVLVTDARHSLYAVARVAVWRIDRENKFGAEERGEWQAVFVPGSMNESHPMRSRSPIYLNFDPAFWHPLPEFET